jgi:hypothetical protein
MSTCVILLWIGASESKGMNSHAISFRLFLCFPDGSLQRLLGTSTEMLNGIGSLQGCRRHEQDYWEDASGAAFREPDEATQTSLNTTSTILLESRAA